MDIETFNFEKDKFLAKLNMSTIERNIVERKTVLQSECGEWMEKRRNLLTASWFGRVCKKRPTTNCGSLVKAMLYGRALSHVASIKYGRDHEQLAIDQLSRQENISIERCGLFIHSEISFFGASPDGISDNKIIEIKCPSSASGLSVDEAILKGKINFWKKDKFNNMNINKRHNWYFQIQGQLEIVDKDECILGIWTGVDHAIKTIHIRRDVEFWETCMVEKLKSFYLDCILPELIDPRYTRSMNIRDPQSIIDTKEINKENESCNIPSTSKC